MDRALGGQFPVYTIDSLRKVPFLFKQAETTGELGDLVEISEKIHGTNMRAGYLPVGFFGRHKFVIGSHRAIKTDMRPLWRRVLDRVRGVKQSAGWYKEDVWMQAAHRHSLEEKLKDHPSVVFYFELYGVSQSGARIQDLTYGDSELGLAVIDAYDVECGTWLPKMELRVICKLLDLETVPVLYSGPYPGLDYVKEMAEGKSTLAPDQIREGVVVAAKEDGRRGKWVSEQYRMRNEEAE
jgi:hypothetical protein